MDFEERIRSVSCCGGAWREEEGAVCAEEHTKQACQTKMDCQIQMKNSSHSHKVNNTRMCITYHERRK